MPAGGPEFNHAMVYVSSAKQSLVFYRDMLGLRLVEEMQGYARLQSATGSTTIALHELGKGQRFDRSLEGMRLYFEVEGLDEYCNELSAKGVKFDQMPKDMEWGWRHAYLRDPDGHEISFYAPAPGRTLGRQSRGKP